MCNFTSKSLRNLCGHLFYSFIHLARVVGGQVKHAIYEYSEGTIPFIFIVVEIYAGRHIPNDIL